MSHHIRIPTLSQTTISPNSLTKIIRRFQKLIIIHYLEQVKLFKTNKKLLNISQILLAPK